MIEVTSITCRATERLEHKRFGEQFARQADSRAFLRRTWVLFSLTILGLGVWDFAIAQFHPLRMSVIVVGGAISVLLIGLLFIHERADQEQQKEAELIQKEADAGLLQRILVSGVQAAWRVTDNGKTGSGYLIRSEGDERLLYLSGDPLQDAMDEYYHQHLESGGTSPFTMASTIHIDQWPQSRRVQLVELSGPMIPQLNGEVRRSELAEAIGNDRGDECLLISNLQRLPAAVTGRFQHENQGSLSDGEELRPESPSEIQ